MDGQLQNTHYICPLVYALSHANSILLFINATLFDDCRLGIAFYFIVIF
jgi:hypothetical protein